MLGCDLSGIFDQKLLEGLRIEQIDTQVDHIGEGLSVFNEVG
jgi:hypothetical protein